MMLSEKVAGQVRFVATYMPNETDWLTVKKQLLITLSPADRASFTRRDEKTKLHFPFNGFERAIRDLWKVVTGNTLVMPPDKMLVEDDPKAYI